MQIFILIGALFIPPFFEPRDPFRKWPSFPPHQSNNDTTQAPDFNILEFIIFSSAMLSVGLLMVCFERYCLNRRAGPLEQERQPLNALELASVRNGYGSVYR